MKNISGLISVIVPVYKVEKYIDRCVGSLIGQTYKNIEIILIDDGSPDNSGKICDEYAKKDNRIKVIHKKNEGVSRARNEGLKIASGEYIAFVDSDDWIERNMYEEMIACAKEKDVDIVRCEQVLEYADKSVKDKNVLMDNSVIDVQSDKSYFINLILEHDVMPSFTLFLMRKEKVDDIQLKFSDDLIIGEDLLFIFTLLCNVKSMYICKRYFYHYNINEQSSINSIDRSDQNAKNLLVLYNKINTLLECNDISLTRETSNYTFYRIYRRIADVTAHKKNKTMIQNFLNTGTFIHILENVDKEKLSIFGKIFLKLFRKRKTNTLYAYCRMFVWARRIKKGVT